MTTTAIFAEIIVVGLQAQAWLTLLVLGVLGDDGVSLDGLEGWAALVTIVVVAASYMLGVIVDRYADAFQRWRMRARKSTPAEQFDEERFTIMDRSPGLTKFLDYQRSRLRIARATMVNGAISVPCLLVFFLRTEPDALLSGFVALALVALTVAAAKSATKLNVSLEANQTCAHGIVLERARGSKEPAAPAGD